MTFYAVAPSLTYTSDIVIRRLVLAKEGSQEPTAVFLDQDQVVQGLSVLFPQLSSSAKTGPSLDRIQKCLANSDTFTLFLATRTSAPHSTTQASIEPKEIVGCLTLITLNLFMNSRAHIEDLVVLDSCRGQGVGRALMQRAMDEAVHTQGCSMVDLTSKPDRIAARTLYESLGFTLRDTGAFRYYAPSWSSSK